jgi:hypothetical protein
VDSIREASGLVVAAPTYFLGPAAVIKLVLDRLLMVVGLLSENLPPPRPAVTLATAGLEDWRGVTLPYLNALAFAFGYVPIESLNAIAPGPGEILLEAPLVAQVLAAGHRLGQGDLSPSPVPLNVCPVCRCESFLLRRKRAVCPICGLEADVEEEERAFRLRFAPALGAGSTAHRWTPEGLQRHMVEWVKATGPRFMARRREIMEARRPFRSKEIGWLCPSTSER